MASSLTPHRPDASSVLEVLPPTSSKKKQAESGNSFWKKAAQMLFSCSSSTPPLTSTRQSQASSSSRSIPAKRAPSSQVFGCTEFRYHIFTYLQFPEVGVAKRVSHIWNDSVPQQDPAQNALNHHHRSRTSLYTSREYLILAKAFKIPLVKKAETAEIWMRIFGIAGSHFSQLKSLDLSKIPKEILLLFNSSAVQIPQVEWLNLAYTSLLSEELHAFLDKTPLLRTLVLEGFEMGGIPTSIIISKGHNWTSLNVDGCRKITTESLQAIGNTCPQLRELNISRISPIKAKGMQALSKGCLALTSLKMQKNTVSIDAFTAMVFGRLVHLDMKECKELNHEGLKAIGRGCSSLTSLNISECNGVRNQAFPSFGFSHLQTLKMKGNYRLTKKEMEDISKGSPNLTTLELINCQFDSNTFEAIVFRRLKILDISMCWSLNPKSIEVLSRGCPEITSVYIGSYVPEFHLTLEAIARLLTHLHTLRIKHASFSQAAIQALGRSRTLLHLTLKKSARIDSISLQTIPLACPQLASLDISYNQEVNPDNLRVIARGCPSLTYIDVSHCSKITIESIRDLALTSRLLKRIIFLGYRIVPFSVPPLREAFPHIKFTDK